MAKLWGRSYSKQQLVQYTGSMYQLAGAKPYVLSDGKAVGTRAVDIKTGSGLEFTVLPDRAMDIPFASYNGRSLCHVTKTGVVSSKYYEAQDDNWFRSYFAGLLTTCGLQNTGASCEDEGRKYGLHGRISNTPAEKLSIREYWDGDEYLIELEGQMREAVFYGENILLTRTIRTALGHKSLKIHDVIENQAFSRVPLFLLYHFNFGFPLLDMQTQLFVNAATTDFYDDAARDGQRDMFRFQKPTNDYFRQVFLHTLRHDASGNTLCALIHPDVGGDAFGVYLKFNCTQLPEFFEFKMMGQGDYEVGLEPSNCLPMGRAAERARNGLKYIEPWNPSHFDLEIGVIEGQEEAQEVIKTIEALA